MVVIAGRIRGKKADYFIIVKRNQGTLNDEIVDGCYFVTTQSVMQKGLSWDFDEQIEKANSRAST